MSVPSSTTVPSVGSTTPARPSTASTCPRRWRRAARRPSRRRGAGRRRGAPRRRRSRRRCPASRASRPRDRWRSASRGPRASRGSRVQLLVLGHLALVGGGLGGGDLRLAFLLALLPELLLADEREDAVGLLRELDRAEARQDRHEVDRREDGVHRRRPAGRMSAIQCEDRGAGGEREAGEERAAGAADAERHREREPEQPDVAWARCPCRC